MSDEKKNETLTDRKRSNSVNPEGGRDLYHCIRMYKDAICFLRSGDI